MTKNSFKKNAIRERMALTGESYLEATRRIEAMTLFTLDDLIQKKMLNADMAEFLASRIAGEKAVSIIISGGVGSGRNIMLNALASAIPNDRWKAVITDSIDRIKLPYNHPSTSIRTVSDSDPEADYISFPLAFRRALRQDPDCIIAHEIEGFDGILGFIYAAETAHSAYTTMTSRDVHEVINMFFDSLAFNGYSVQKARTLITENIDLVIVMEKAVDGSRYCSGIYELPDHTEARPGAFPLEPVPLWVFSQVGTNKQGKITGEWVVKNKPGSM
jgi:Flp pilus assembly CpaF family ATPase